MRSKILAIVEVLALLLCLLFVGGKLAALFAKPLKIPEQASPIVFQWIPLVVCAWLLDRWLRGRSPFSWGLKSSGSILENCQASARLLFLGGVLPMLVTWSSVGDSGELFDGMTTGFALLAPLLGQEIYMAGFGQRRLSDSYQPLAVAGLIASLFVLAHAGHAADGAKGIVFLLLMGWQGLVWSAARSAKISLYPLLAAHFILLICYMYPGPGLITVVLAGMLAGPGMLNWLKKLAGVLIARPKADVAESYR